MLEILEPDEFSKQVESYAVENNVNHIEALTQLTEELNIGPETVKKLINRNLRLKLKYDAERLHLFRNVDRVAQIPLG